MTFRFVVSVIGGGVACCALSSCSSFLKSMQSAMEKTTGQGALVVPAGSASSACAPRPVATDQGTLLIDEAVRKSLAMQISRATVTESGNVPPEDSRALYRDAAIIDPAIGDKAVQSATSALDILSSPTHKKMLVLMALATSSSTSRNVDSTLATEVAATPTLKIDRKEWANYANTVAAVSMTDGWTALSVYTANRLAAVPANDSSRSALTGLHRESSLISAYLAAYFRQGKFVSLTINPSQFDSELQAKVNSWLKDTGGTGAAATPANLVDTIAGDVLPSQCKAPSSGAPLPTSCTLLGSVGQTGFVTRSGDKFAFPALTFQLDPLGQQKLIKPQIDVKNVIGDLVRIVLEATGDAMYQVPAAQGSTACTVGLLTCYDPSKAPVSASNFTKVNQYAAEAETVASGGIGLLVRGGFWVALNNESLATAIETGVGVTARKTAERVAWDYLSCANPTGDFRAVAVSGGAYRTLAVTLQ